MIVRVEDSGTLTDTAAVTVNVQEADDGYEVADESENNLFPPDLPDEDQYEDNNESDESGDTTILPPENTTQTQLSQTIIAVLPPARLVVDENAFENFTDPKIKEIHELRALGVVYCSPISKNNSSRFKNISVIPKTINYSIDQVGEMLWLKLDHFLEELNSQNDYEIKIDAIKIGTVTTLVGTISIGYITWILRGGILLAGMLSQMPAWLSFDPLPVLDSWKKEQKKFKHNHDSKDKKDDEIERNIQSFIQ